jgi:hypothetical protein
MFMFHEHLLSYMSDYVMMGRGRTYEDIGTDFTEDFWVGESIQIIVLNLEVLS